MFLESVNYINIPGILLLWVESLAFVLLFVVLTSALASCIKKKLWRRLAIAAILIAALLPLLVGGCAIVLGVFLLYIDIQPHWFFAYSLTWTLSYVAACYILYKKELLFQGIDNKNVCCSFGKLTAAFGIVTAIFMGTFSMMDSSAKMALLSYHTRLAIQASVLHPSHVPDRKNAFVIYEKAFKSLGTTPSWFENGKNINFNANTKEVKDFLTAKKETLQLIQTAIAMDDYYIPMIINFSFRLSESNNEYDHYHDLAILLTIDAKMKAANGDFVGAYRNIVNLHDMAKDIAEGTSTIASITSIRTHTMGVSLLEEIFASNSTIPKDFRSNFGSQYDLLNNHIYSRLAEAASVTSDFSYKIATGQSVILGNGTWDFIFPFYRIFCAPYDISAENNYWHKYTEILKKPSYEVFVGLESYFSNGFLVGSSMLMSVYHGGWGGELRVFEAQARLLAGDAAVAAITYKQEYGHYPRSFDDIIPTYLAEKPIDPFTGKSMLIKATQNGLIIYSTGTNLKDDGSVPSSNSYSREFATGDVAFYLGDAYDEYRVKPALAREKAQAEAERNSEKKN